MSTPAACLTRIGRVDFGKLASSFFRFGEGAATAILLLLGLTVVAIGYLWLSQHEEVAA